MQVRVLPDARGRRRRGGPAPGCYLGRGPGHEVRLLHLPPGSVGPVGVDARLSSGRSRVRVPYGARSAVVAAGCQSGLSIRAARVRSPSTAHHTRPHGLAVKDARFSAGRTPVQVRLGVPRLSWRNWQTHRPRVAAPQWREGSIPRRSTSRHGGEPVFADEAHVDAHLLAMQETAGSRPAIRSMNAVSPPGGTR